MSKNAWGFDETDIGDGFDGDAYEKSLRRHNAPIDSHDCDHWGCEGRYANVGYPTHEWQEIFDDFKLSNRQREDITMEIIRSRGRTNREMILIRRYISTLDGSFVIRLSNATELSRERYGDLTFDDEQQQIDYYNYCIGSFAFSPELKLGQDEDEDGGGFFDELDGLTWDIDEDDDDSEYDWDTDDDELTW